MRRREMREGSVHIEGTREILARMVVYESVVATTEERVDDIVAVIARMYPERDEEEWRRLLLTRRLYIDGRRAAVHRETFVRAGTSASTLRDSVISTVRAKRLH